MGITPPINPLKTTKINSKYYFNSLCHYIHKTTLLKYMHEKVYFQIHFNNLDIFN